MQKMHKLIAMLTFSVITAGCQMPPASKGFAAKLNWNMPTPTSTWTGCTAALPCTVDIYAEKITGSTCDPATSSNFKKIGSVGSGVTTYTDNTASGTECYGVTVVQGSQNSDPSNVVQLVIPGVPPAASLAPPVVASSQAPPQLVPMPSATKQLASLSPIQLRVEVVRYR